MSGRAKTGDGAKATASWYSLVETAKANGLEPYGYLRKIFEEIPLYLRDDRPVTDLLPWNVDLDSVRPSVVGG
jgi:transposase